MESPPAVIGRQLVAWSRQLSSVWDPPGTWAYGLPQQGVRRYEVTPHHQPFEVGRTYLCVGAVTADQCLLAQVPAGRELGWTFYHHVQQVVTVFDHHAAIDFVTSKADAATSTEGLDEWCAAQQSSPEEPQPTQEAGTPEALRWAEAAEGPTAAGSSGAGSAEDTWRGWRDYDSWEETGRWIEPGEWQPWQDWAEPSGEWQDWRQPDSAAASSSQEVQAPGGAVAAAVAAAVAKPAPYPRRTLQVVPHDPECATG